jgi:hypothetical protein
VIWGLAMGDEVLDVIQPRMYCLPRYLESSSFEMLERRVLGDSAVEGVYPARRSGARALVPFKRPYSE